MVTLSLAKQHLEYEDDDRDDLIGQYVEAAAGWVENYTGLLLTRRAVTRRFDSCISFYDLQIGPTPEIDSITYLDSELVETTIDAADYTLIGGRLYPASAFPYARYGLLATITAGYDGDVPADLVSAQLLIIGHLFANREAVVTGTIATAIPLAAEALCGPYRTLIV